MDWLLSVDRDVAERTWISYFIQCRYENRCDQLDRLDSIDNSELIQDHTEEVVTLITNEQLFAFCDRLGE